MTTHLDAPTRTTLTDLAAMWRKQADLHEFPTAGDEATAARALMRTVEAMLPSTANDQALLRVASELGQVFTDEHGAADSVGSDHLMLWLSVHNMTSVLTTILSGGADDDGDPQEKQVAAVRGPLMQLAD